jgi:glycosyltransferase involved in cell wall biosynthesis
LDRVTVVAPLWCKLPKDGYGAIEKVVLERAQVLRSLGYRVQLVGNIEDPKLATEVVNLNSIRKLPLSLQGHIRWLLTLGWTRYALSFLKAKRLLWNTVVVTDAATMDPINNYILCSILGRSKTLLVLHGNSYQTNGHMRPILEPLRPIAKMLNYAALNRNVAELLSNLGFRTYYCPNGIFLPPQTAVVDSPEDHCVFIGTLNRDKAPHLAIRLARDCGERLILIGPIRDQRYFDSMIRPKLGNGIEYLGEVTAAVRDQRLRTAKALFFTSTWNDPQPTVILEALSFGVPVVATPAGKYSGLYDMVVQDENGLIDEPRSIPGRFKSVLSMSRASIYRATQKKWAWEHVIREFHIPVLQKLAGEEDNGNLPRRIEK